MSPFWRMTAACCVLSLAMKVPALPCPATEADEVIYLTLARQLQDHGSYSLRGTDLLPHVPAEMYDRPLHYHPPGFALLLVPFTAAGVPRLAVVLSWLGQVLAILAVALLIDAHSRSVYGRPPEVTMAALFGLVGCSLDPVLSVVGTHVWMDNLLAGLVALGLALLAQGWLRPRAGARVLGAGVCFALAGSLKLSALSCLPWAGLLLLARRDPPARLGWLTACLALPLLPLGLWLLHFHAVYGVWLPDWVFPSPATVVASPFLREVTSRPWYHFGRTLLRFNPVLPAALAGSVLGLLRPGASGGRRWHVVALWAAFYLGFITLVCARGMGFMLRHLAPLVPLAWFAVYLLWRGRLGAGPVGRVLAVLYLAALAGCVMWLTWQGRPDDFS